MPGLTRLGAWLAEPVRMSAQEAQFLSFTDALPALILKFALAAAYAEKPVLLVAFFLLSGR